jgi:xanthine dehydrogenase YagS FAD-binding subunit
MNKFSWLNVTSIDEALKNTSATVSDLLQPRAGENEAVIKAGGMDLLDLMKEGLVKPAKLVQIQDIPGLSRINLHQRDGLQIGAGTKLVEIEKDELIKKNYAALHMAVGKVATPNIRNMATLGGNLAQRTRCWYFRSIHHDCIRKGSGTCYAQEGKNEFHAIMHNSLCTSVHASSVATALMAHDAEVVIINDEGETKRVRLEEFFVLPDDNSKRENILEAKELITMITLPPVGPRIRSYYIKQGARESYDWPIADVAVVAEMDGSRCKKAKIVLGAAAPVPIAAVDAANMLKGKEITEELAIAAAEMAMIDATPLSRNQYKIPVFKSIIKRAILKIR